MIFCARATRGLRMIRRSRQTVLLARRAPTIKRWSLDARSEEQSAYSFWGSRGIRKPSLGLMARLGVPVGGRVRKSRAVEDQSAPIPEEKVSKIGRMGQKRPGALHARRGWGRNDTRADPLLPERARSECARSTAAGGTTRVPFLEK